MQIDHVTSTHVVQFFTDSGEYIRFSGPEWFHLEGSSWVPAECASELEAEYQEILREEPGILGLEEDCCGE